jgi:hypothetical protein
MRRKVSIELTFCFYASVTRVLRGLAISDYFIAIPCSPELLARGRK